MNNKKLRMTALLVLFSVILGMLWVMPTAVSADGTVSPSLAPTDITPWSGSIGSGYAGGTGSEGDPYQIATAEQLEYFRQETLVNATADVTAHFKLTADIVYNTTISDSSKSIKGCYNGKGKVFAGTFDGGGHTIYNLYSDFSGTSTATTSLALFQDIGPDGVIKNVNIDGVYLKPTNTSSGNAAVIAYGSLKGTLSNVHVRNATLEAVTVSGLVHDVASTGSITNCSVENLTGKGTNAAGIAYSVVFGSVMMLKNCTVSGSLTATANAGGIAATASGNVMLMESCSNRATVNGGEKAGGLIGNCSISSNNGALCVTACVNYGSVVSAGYAGGLFGYYYKPNTGLRLVSCSNFGSVDGVTASGGFMGYQAGKADQTVVLRGCMINADIGMKGTSAYSGGVVGHFSGGAGGRTLITSTMIKVNIKATEYAGSIIGCTTNTGTGGNAQNLDSAWVYAVVTAGTKASDWAVVSNGNDLQKGSPTGTNGFYIVKNETASTSNTVTMAAFDSTAYATLKSFAVTYTYSGTNQTSYKTTSWIKDANGTPILANTLGFTGATMTLGENMMLNLKLALAVTDGTGVTGVTFVKNGEATPGNASVDANGYYTAAFACDAADFAKKEIYHIVVEVNGTSYTSTNILYYAPVEYTTALYNDEGYSDTYEDIIVKMLSMAAQSEANKYGTASTSVRDAAAGITLLTGEALAIPTDMKYYALDTDAANAAIAIIDKFAMTGAELNGNINLVFTVTDANVKQLRVTANGFDRTYEVVDGYVTLGGLNAGNIRNVLTLDFQDATGATVTSADGTLGTAQFSVGNYLQAVIVNGSDSQKALATAMVLYMMSVREYALAD